MESQAEPSSSSLQAYLAVEFCKESSSGKSPLLWAMYITLSYRLVKLPNLSLDPQKL